MDLSDHSSDDGAEVHYFNGVHPAKYLMFVVVCCLLFVFCFLFFVFCLLFVVCCLLFVVYCCCRYCCCLFS